MMISKELQGEPMPHSIVYCLLGLFLHTFQTSRVLSNICSSKTSHALCSGSFKKNSMCVWSAILLCVCFSKNILSSDSFHDTWHKLASKENRNFHFRYLLKYRLRLRWETALIPKHAKATAFRPH